VSIDEGLGEAYVRSHLESRKIPISEDGSKSTNNNATKDLSSTTLYQPKILPEYC
jgi:hypothetical protein